MYLKHGYFGHKEWDKIINYIMLYLSCLSKGSRNKFRLKKVFEKQVIGVGRWKIENIIYLRF